MHEFRTQRRIEFVDTDQGGIVHFSRYFVFMETAEHQFLNAIGASVDMMLDGEKIGWPRVSASIDYKSPARFGDTLDILVRVLRKGNKSMTYGFTISANGNELAIGRMTSVCCRLNPGHKVEPIAIPSAIAERLEQAPESSAE